MSDNYQASITIPKAYATEEIKALIMTHAPEILDDTDKIFCCEHGLAANGLFEVLEDELINRKIPFDRNSSGFFEIKEEIRYYRPAATDHTPERDVTIYLGDHGPEIPTHEIKNLMEFKEEEFKQKIIELMETYDPEITPIDAL